MHENLESEYDVKAFFRTVGGIPRYGTASDSDLLNERPFPDKPVEFLDVESKNLNNGQTLEFGGFVDGIQQNIRATYVEHRPVLLQHVAAACLTSNAKPLAVEEEMHIVCSEQEAAWLEAANTGIPLKIIEETEPAKIERKAHDMLAGRREHLERKVTQKALEDHTGVIVVDGGLLGRPVTDRLVGVVKTTKTRYLEDEAVLRELQEGWRSPRFKLPGHGADRYTAYMRLTTAERRPWNFGLIRIETWDPNIIDSAGSGVLQYKRAPGTDARWDRHISGVINVERYLRARRSPVFGTFN